MRVDFRQQLAFLFLAGCLNVAAPPLAAQEDKDTKPDELQQYELTVSPAALPEPALKFRLLPPPRDRAAGNRAPYYLRAVVHWESSLPAERYDRFNEVLRANDGEEFDPDAVRQILPDFDPILRQLEKAAVRDHCDWNLDLEYLQGWEAISFSLEEFQQMREFARLLMLKGRLEVAEGRFDDAILTLQIGHQLARDVAKPPTLINSLIGIAFTTILNTVVVDWIDQPQAPNLYWALATRPRPFIDLHDAYEFEAGLPFRMFPVLRDPESTQRSDQQWNRLIRELVVDLENIETYWEKGRPVRSEEALAAADRAIDEALPVARRELLEAGFDREQLDAMADGQLLAIHTAAYVRERFDQWLVILSAPPAQAEQMLQTLEEELQAAAASNRASTRRESLSVVEKLLPALKPSLLAGLRTEQRLDSLQCLEAIRAYAAAHDGELPESLEAMTSLTCPRNARTGEPFAYTHSDGVATLTVPPLPERLPRSGRRFTIRVE